jgi:restriction system protein
MSRRSSLFDDLMTLGARLPWGVSLALACVSFLAFQWIYVHFSTPEPAPSMADLATVAQHRLWGTLASILRFVVPIGLVIGSVVSMIKRRRTKASFDRVAKIGSSEVSRLSWREFEAMIGEGFRRRGYRVTGNESDGPDGGIDLVLVRGAERVLVQCKHWRRYSVGVAVIREFYGVMSAAAVRQGFVVTSGTFTPDAYGFAAQCGIELMDGARLEEWVSYASASVLPGGISAVPLARPIESTTTSAPECPKCGVDMVLRTSQRGSTSGNRFWGCSLFPRCRGTRPA